jgi:hypothetical protein
MTFLTRFRKRRTITFEDATHIAKESGLADIDPQPLTHTAGEGIVPGEDEEARHNVQDVRDRLPTTSPGK